MVDLLHKTHFLIENAYNYIISFFKNLRYNKENDIPNKKMKIIIPVIKKYKNNYIDEDEYDEELILLNPNR